MNTKQYKLMMLITALPVLYCLSWRGLAAVVAVPAVPFWAVQTRNTSGMLLMALFAAVGLIVANWQKNVPCPLPQMLMSLLMGAGSVAMSIWQSGDSLLTMLEQPQGSVVRIMQSFTLLLPGVTAVSFLFTLLLPQARRSSLGMAFWNLIVLVLLSVTTQSARVLMSMPTVAWSRYLYALEGAIDSPYGSAMAEVMEVYRAIPPVVRACVGAAVTLFAAGRLYRESVGRLRRPAGRPVVPPRTDDRLRVQPGNAAPVMSARDRELLDMLSAQTVSGNPVGLNLDTGSVGFGRDR